MYCRCCVQPWGSRKSVFHILYTSPPSFLASSESMGEGDKLEQKLDNFGRKIENKLDNSNTGSMSSNNKQGVTGAVTGVTGTVCRPWPQVVPASLNGHLLTTDTM